MLMATMLSIGPAAADASYRAAAASDSRRYTQPIHWQKNIVAAVAKRTQPRKMQIADLTASKYMSVYILSICLLYSKVIITKIHPGKLVQLNIFYS